MTFKTLIVSALVLATSIPALAHPTGRPHRHGGVRPGPSRPIGRHPGGIVYHGGRRVYRSYPGYTFRHPAYRVRYDRGFNFDAWLSEEMRFRRIEELGSTWLATQDYDVIPVRECGIKQVRMRVKYADAIIDQVMVVLADGRTLPLETREYYEEGSVGAWKDLPGYSSCVREVIVIGSTLSHFRTQAEVEVYGRR